jgi:hypothetical protein
MAHTATVFTGKEAAFAIVGELPTKSDTAAHVLVLMSRAYENTRAWFTFDPKRPQDAATPTGMLVSVEMADAQSRLLPDDLDVVAGGDWRFQLWLRCSDSAFDRQYFSPTVLTRWLEEIGVTPHLDFRAQAHAVVAKVAATAELPQPQRADTQPQAANAETAPRPLKTPDESCDRFLQSFEEEKAKKERGALAEVVNPGDTQPRTAASALPIKDAPEPQAVKPVVDESASAVIHSTQARRNTLTPVIELAQKQCRNPKDTAEVWAELLMLAEKKQAPLIGATEDGLQYLRDGEAAIFTRASLSKRLARQAPVKGR